MIDVYASEATFANPHDLARDLAAAVMRWEQVPDIALFRKNTAAFVHQMAPAAISNVDGESNYIRVEVLTPHWRARPGEATRGGEGVDGDRRWCR
jgi:hypothetical protein